MSDTPETDSAILASEGQWSFVLKETCQRLERERNSLQDQRDLSIRMAKERERERDEARVERDEWIARFRADEQLIKEAMISHPQNPETESTNPASKEEAPTTE